MSQYQKKTNFSAVPSNLRLMRAGLSQAEFGRFLGLTNQVTYHRYESGRVPKVHILQQFATRLGITVAELLTPIPADRAFDIVVRAISHAPAPEPGKVTAETAKSFGEASGVLVASKSVKAITEAFQLETMPQEDLSRFFGHIVMVANRAPVELMKYYVLIRYAIGKELAKRLK